MGTNMKLSHVLLDQGWFCALGTQQIGPMYQQADPMELPNVVGLAPEFCSHYD